MSQDPEPEALPLVLTVYWLPGEYVEVDQGEMQDWEAVEVVRAEEQVEREETE